MAGTDAFEALETAFEELLLQQKLLSQQCHALRHAAYWQDLRLIRCLQSWQSVAQLEKAEKEEAERAEAKKEAERKEAEREEAERKEAERKEAERKEAERKEAEKKEAERKEAELKEAERKEAEREEAERKEAERKEAERKEAENKEAERKEAEMKEAERKEAEREEAERKEAERKEAERKEAELKEAERKEAERKEAELKEAERKEAEREEAERKEAERKEAERKEAERKEAERKEAEMKEAERKEAEREEAERKEAERKEAELKEAERKEAEREEAERKEAERKEAELKEAERKEAEREEAEKKEAERKEAEMKEAERKEAERKEAEMKEAERKEAELKEAERKEAERKEAERKEAEMKEAERKEAERKEAERKEAEKKEAEMKEAARKEAERKEAEMKEAERKEAERKEAERKEAERKEAARKRKEKKLADAEQKEEGGYPQAVMAMYVPELPAQKPEDSAMLGEAKFDVPVPVVAPKDSAELTLSDRIRSIRPETERWEASARFRRLNRLAWTHFAFYRGRKELRFLLSGTLWRWFLTASRRRCVGARSALRSNCQRVADLQNLAAAFRSWRGASGSLVAVDLSSTRPYRAASRRASAAKPGPWLGLLLRLAFRSWAPRRKPQMALKAAVTWGGLDWLARRASQDARLSETLLTELRCCANELHEDIARSEASLAALQRQRLLRACLRTWRFRCSAWSPRSLLPVALRYWLSLSLVRWAVLARRRQLPRFFCGRRLMLQEALSWRVVWTCFAAWRSLLEADAQARAKSLLAAVRALGAFDLQIVQLHRVTGTGLAALQVKLLDLSGAPLQTALAAKVEFLPCGFCCRRHRYFLLLRTASFNAWRTRAARLRKAPAPEDRSPLLRLVLDTWRARSRAERLKVAVERRRKVLRQLMLDLAQLRCKHKDTMFEDGALALLEA